MIEFTIEPCKTKAKYSVKPKTKVKIDFSKLICKMETPIVCVIEMDGEEIIVHKYGELQFKTLEDKEKIKKIAEKIFSSCTSS